MVAKKPKKKTKDSQGNYELAVVITGSATVAKKKQVEESINKLVSVIDGKVLDVKDWGEKKLAYEIEGAESGSFLIFSLDLKGGSASGFNDKLRLEQQISRYLLTKQEQK